MEANGLCSLQIHIDYARGEQPAEVARRTLNALRLVRPEWFLEGGDLPIVRADLFAELAQAP